jgi:cytochrome c556
MEKKLTPAQSKELDDALPEQFKRIDAEFHARAEKLGAAAASHDAELVIHHYTRMLESCTQCHARFAPARFSGFLSPAQDGHHH